MSADQHNRLAAEFVHSVGRGTVSESEICVVLESIIFGSMEIMLRLYAVKPATATALVDSAVHHAIERFAEARQ